MYLQEMTEMARAKPCPVSIETLLLAWMFKITGIGSPLITQTIKEFCENARKRLKKSKGYYPKENIRVLWWDVPIAFANLFPWLEKKFGAVTVADFIGRVYTPYVDTTSEETMVRDLSRVHLHVAMGRNTRGPSELVTQEMERLMEQYSPDCMVFTGHNGCKHGSALSRIKKHIIKSHNIPALFLSSDIFDTRTMNEPAIQRELTDFFYMHGFI